MRRIPFYPFVVGLISLLGIYVSNMSDATPRELLMPLALLWFGTAVLFAIGLILTRNAHRTAAIVATIVFSFMTYGYWVDTLWSLHRQPLAIRYDRWGVLIIEALVIGVLAYRVTRRTRHPQTWTKNLNRLSLIVLACPALLGFANLLRAKASKPSGKIQAPPVLIEKPDANATKPDIYLFIMDAHGRNDILKERYHYDDSPLLDHLRSVGFYVADQSTSNYMWTVMSLTATLNCRYVEEVEGNDSAKLQDVTNLLHNSAVVAQLKHLGYRTVTFESSEKWLCFTEFDSYYRVSNQIGLTPLQQLILDTSALSQLGGQAIKSKLVLDRFHAKREMFKFKLAEVPAVASKPGPKFVLVHFFEPHTPFVFAADGSDPIQRGYGSMLDGLNDEVTNDQYHAWYREQAIYADACIAKMIDQLLARSKTPPIIVLMGDHGPRSGVKAEPSQADLEECMSNLTAIYLPGKNHAGLYPQITPVNIFRVIFNDYFDARMPLLEDRSYYSYPSQFASRDVTEDVKPDEKNAASIQ